MSKIWHEIFDEVSTAYHKKVAKDRANEEGLVVHPPSEDTLPGEGEVTYASQVQDILIPYTTKEDRFTYYEERNYVNDVNREHTEVLQTYDRELKARETYTYGKGRSSYLNNETGDQYQYLTNQAGSVTGLTKDGHPVASTSYHLYGSTKASTDTTGNPFAYNGEARDSTGLDYLRARYYDSGAGTFLTEDSYQGELTAPLRQNRYSYVQNNPVNYTDPSGHLAKTTLNLPDGGRLRRQKRQTNSSPKPLINQENGTLYAPSTREHKAHVVAQDRTNLSQYTPIPPSYVSRASTSSFQYTQRQQARVHEQTIAQQQANREYASARGGKGQAKIREAQNLSKNWTKALEESIRQTCTIAKRVKDTGKKRTPTPKELIDRVHAGDTSAILELAKGFGKKTTVPKKYVIETKPTDKAGQELRTHALDFRNYGIGVVIHTALYQDGKRDVKTNNKRIWNNLETSVKNFIGEVLPIYDTIRLVTGKDPVTKEKTSRLAAAGWLAADLIPGNDLLKGGKLVSKVDDVADVAKAIDKVDDVGDATKVYTKSDLRDMADDVAGIFGNDVSELKNGYKVEIPNGNKPIVVRIMEQGSGGRKSPYFRISIDGKGSLDLNGELSSLREFTHIDISDDTVKQIVETIKKYKGGK